MAVKRAPPTDAPRVYRYVTSFYGRSLRPVVFTMSLITAIWALAWTVSSFKQLKLAESDDLPKLAPLAIAQGVMFAVACGFQTFGIMTTGMQRFSMVRIYAFLCAMSTLLVIGVGSMRVVTHFVFKNDLITECTQIAQTGVIGSVFGIWGSDPSNRLDAAQAAGFCNSEWSHDTWAEIIALVLEGFFGLMFTSLAFAYYRQALDPASPANTSRLPSRYARNCQPPNYDPSYDRTAYVPVYLPPPGPPPEDGKPPEYKRGAHVSFAADTKDAKGEDPFADGPSVPMPTHWVEDQEAGSSPKV